MRLARKNTDYGLIILLIKDEVSGLKVLDREEWVKFKLIPGVIVVNVGDMLSRFTNGLYVSGKHKVVALSKGVSKYSIALFQRESQVCY